MKKFLKILGIIFLVLAVIAVCVIKFILNYPENGAPTQDLPAVGDFMSLYLFCQTTILTDRYF